MIYPDLYKWIMENTYPRTLKDGVPAPDFRSMEDFLENIEKCYGREVTKHVIDDGDNETCLLIILPKEPGLGEVEIFFVDIYDGREDNFYGREPREDSAFEPLFASALRQVYHQLTEWRE